MRSTAWEVLSLELDASLKQDPWHMDCVKHGEDKCLFVLCDFLFLFKLRSCYIALINCNILQGSACEVRRALVPPEKSMWTAERPSHP